MVFKTDDEWFKLDFFISIKNIMELLNIFINYII